jgi:hypothetical protein
VVAPFGWKFKKTIRDAFSEAKPGDCLILCDDNVTSGSQALCQFLAWMAIPEDKWTNDQRSEKGIERTPLDSRDRKLLTELDLWLVTAVGTRKAADLLASELPKIGITRFKGVHYGMEISNSNHDLDALESFLTEVGTSLMISIRHPGKSKKDLSAKAISACRADAGGYGGAKGLFCTASNVPVGTITALWASSTMSRSMPVG